MKKYEKANIEIINISLEEIILASGIVSNDSPLGWSDNTVDEVL